MSSLKEATGEFFGVLGVGENFHPLGRLIEPFLPDFRMVNVATGEEKEAEFWGLVEGLGGEAFGKETLVNVRVDFLGSNFSIERVGGSREVGLIDRLPGKVGVAGVGGDS